MNPHFPRINFSLSGCDYSRVTLESKIIVISTHIICNLLTKLDNTQF